ETRNVDDQVAWLDNSHVMYGVPQGGPDNATIDTWVVPADGLGSPTLLVPGGESPVVLPAPTP
ncbi:MAG: hypothetical protein JO265_03825, partial [Acidimicrobiia bacterium]|nr:hypothetical protein [Acidimicrobiia bacterium]